VSSSPPSDEDLRPIREALARLLDAMRPDWGGPEAIESRIRFAEDRLRMSLTDICIQAVQAATIPTTAPDAFIRQNPDRTADAAAAKSKIDELRQQLARHRPRPAPVTLERTDADDAAIAADREWLERAVAPLYELEQERRTDREQRFRTVRPAFQGLPLEE
jgi:hypothetical protein